MQALVAKFSARLPVRIFPRQEHIKKYMAIRHYPFFDKYFHEAFEAGYAGRICFLYNNKPGSISRFKLLRLAYDAQQLLESYAHISDAPLMDASQFESGITYEVSDSYFALRGLMGLDFYASSLF